jgi:hypothetical protein
VSTAVATAVELVHFQPESLRATATLAALRGAAKAAGVGVTVSSAYRGRSPWLLLWGPGAPDRAEAMRRHVAAGGHVIALDLAYWDRERKARVSFDAAHPSAWVMRRDLPATRLRADRVTVVDAWKPTGPVVVAGLGDKARVQYGADVIDRWEARMIAACRERWPDRPILYRKKKAGSPVPAHVQQATMQPIDAVLTKASLLVTWHSNVAVDAIRLGVPVICRDGAAAAVCAPDFEDEDPQPLAPAVRDQFLANLAWFQWGTTPPEAAGFWRFAQETLS